MTGRGLKNFGKLRQEAPLRRAGQVCPCSYRYMQKKCETLKRKPRISLAAIPAAAGRTLLSRQKDQVSRREIAMGARAAARAGNRPPIKPMIKAMPTANPSSQGVTRNAKATWLKV